MVEELSQDELDALIDSDEADDSSSDISQDEIDALLSQVAGDDEEGAQAGSPAPDESTAPAAPASSVSIDKMRAQNPDLDRALSIPISVTAILAEKVMSMEDILGLFLGSLLQFDKNVEAPIDLHVNNIAFAKGHVVTVGERTYGLLLDDILSGPDIVDTFTRPQEVS